MYYEEVSDIDVNVNGTCTICLSVLWCSIKLEYVEGLIKEIFEYSAKKRTLSDNDLNKRQANEFTISKLKPIIYANNSYMYKIQIFA